MQFMQDNAPGHRAYASRDWFQDNNVTLFSPWPSKSPDMNPIENLWAQMETALNRRANRQRNEHQLWNAVREEWARVDMFDVRRLVFSMR